MTRAELIATLVTDKFSGFKEGDEAILEAASDARLDEFRTASDTRKAAERAAVKLDTDHKNVSARLKVAEDRIKASEQELSEDEFLTRAPAEFKTLIEAHKAEEAQLRASIISQLKDLGANTEEELKKMKTEDLRMLAKYARVPEPDFSGRGLPRERDQDTNDYTPPNPYDAPVKQLQANRQATATKH